MTLYLPIAELSVNIFIILMLGGLTGMLSGIFGVGGGFLVTPFLIFLGIPPAVAVATSANQIIATSLTGFASHWRRGNVDFQIGFLMLVGGLVGSTLGIALFSALKRVGQIDLVISLAYVFFLGSIGVMMARESWQAMKQQTPSASAPLKHFAWLQTLPMRYRFRRSDREMSVFAPLLVGVLVGIMVSLMGIGGGFLMIPAMIYLLGMPTALVIGTSLFQIIFTTSYATILHAYHTQSVDVVLALLLLAGSMVGVHYGTRVGGKLPAEQLRVMLAGLVLLVSLKMAFGLFIHPEEVYSVTVEGRL
jgi:uncharacterized membrane protein YfcA